MTAADRAATEAFAPAKINLTLHVTGHRADGYHLLDSLVVFSALGDRIRLRPAERPSLRVTGPMAAGVPEDGRNLALRAARLAGPRGWRSRSRSTCPPPPGSAADHRTRQRCCARWGRRSGSRWTT